VQTLHNLIISMLETLTIVTDNKCDIMTHVTMTTFVVVAHHNVLCHIVRQSDFIVYEVG